MLKLHIINGLQIGFEIDYRWKWFAIDFLFFRVVYYYNKEGFV